MQPHQFNLTKAAYSVGELLAILPISRTTLYRAVQAEQLKATKLGSRTMFLAPHVAEFLAALALPPNA